MYYRVVCNIENQKGRVQKMTNSLKSKSVEKKVKDKTNKKTNNSFDFTLLITVLLLLSMRDNNGIIC